MTDIPRRLPAVAEDRWIYASRPTMDESHHTVVMLDGQLSEVRLQRALRLTIDAEPVFGCRFRAGGLTGNGATIWTAWPFAASPKLRICKESWSGRWQLRAKRLATL